MTCVSTPQPYRRPLDQADRGTVASRRDGRAQRGTTTADYQNVDTVGSELVQMMNLY